MTFDTLNMRATGIGDGVATAFPFAFLVTAVADLIVFKVVDATGVRTDFILTTDYTVTGLNIDTGGTVTLVVALPTGETLFMQRRPEVTQKIDIKNQGPFKALTHENAFDRSRMIDQRLQDDVERSLRLPQREAPSTLLSIIPRLEDRKGLLLGFNATSGAPEARAQGSAPAEIMWQVKGNLSLGDNPFPRYRARKNITFLNFDFTAVTAGTGGTTVILIQKNGGTVATITVADGSRTGDSVPVNVSLIPGDEIFPEISSVSPTIPPADVSILVRI